LKIAPLDFETNHLNQQEKLKLLNRKILQSAVELLNVMIHDTPNANKKMEQLRLLLIHFHHGLNEYRPHQARETLMLIMKKQIEKKKQAIDAINSALSETKTKCNEVYINLKK
jgi:mediator of RNA polymerase II transcription subunit 7